MNFSNWSSYFTQIAWTPAMTLLTIAGLIFWVIVFWRIFSKANEPGFAAIIPIYNLYTIFKISYGSGWMILWLLLTPIAIVILQLLGPSSLLTLIPILLLLMAMISISVQIPFRLARAFGKGGGFGFGLLFLWPIFGAILAFGSAEYRGPALAGR